MKILKPYHVCCVSILNFCYPLYTFYNKPVTNVFENGCAAFTFAAIICNQLFWVKPIRFSFYHKTDGIVAKTTFAYFFIYTHSKNVLSKKQFIEYYFLIFLMGLMFYLSNHFSSRNWCCFNHLFIHTIFHFLSSIGMLYAYL
jgi:hypothetical protein